MATASSAQREPSMEEILASIRRIIEDSDTGRKQPGEYDEPRQDLGSPPAPEVEAFRAELRVAPEPERKPATLAEVQAQLPPLEPAVARPVAPSRPAAPDMGTRPRGIGDLAARAEPARARTAPATDTNIADWRREIARSDTPAKPVAERIIPAAEPLAPAVERVAPAADRTGFETPAVPSAEPKAMIAEAETKPEAISTVAPLQNEAPAAVESAPARQAILSEQAGRQVAAAFGELSDAFAARSRKSFDEMAEEMLRPMLQDWLDNNLPTLVERLVREEIERVARGAQ